MPHKVKSSHAGVYTDKGFRVSWDRYEPRKLRVAVRGKHVTDQVLQTTIKPLEKCDGVREARVVSQTGLLIVSIDRIRPASKDGARLKDLAARICSTIVLMMVANAREVKRQTRRTEASKRQKAKAPYVNDKAKTAPATVPLPA